jgi:hypothetical protein
LTFDRQYCPSIVIRCPVNQPWSADIVGLPFDGKGSVLEDQPYRVLLKDLGKISTMNANLGLALGAVIQSIGEILVKCKIANVKELNENNIKQILGGE